jgi:hypothetical protein
MRYWSQNPKGKDLVEDVGVDVRIILKWNLLHGKLPGDNQFYQYPPKRICVLEIL